MSNETSISNVLSGAHVLQALIRQKMLLQAGVSINKFRYKCTNMM